MLILVERHWSDKPLLMLLEFLVRELGESRLLVIGTYRDMELSRQHPLSETLGALSRERLFNRLVLRGISRQDVDQFIEATSDVRAPQGLIDAVYSNTEGNPFFVNEVVRLLVQEEELSSESTRTTDS